MRTTIALLGIGILAVTVTFGACLVVLHNDYVELSGHQTTQTARPGVITCAEFRHRRWTVPGAYGVLPVRCGK
jgi:hypothetical protein